MPPNTTDENGLAREISEREAQIRSQLKQALCSATAHGSSRRRTPVLPLLSCFVYKYGILLLLSRKAAQRAVKHAALAATPAPAFGSQTTRGCPARAVDRSVSG